MKKNNQKRMNTKLLMTNIILILAFSLLSIQSFAIEINSTILSQNITDLKTLSAQLSKESYQTYRLNSKIYEAENHLANLELEQSSMAINDANQLITLAKETRSLLEKSDNNIIYANKIGLNTSLAEEYLIRAKQEFIIENYIGAKELNSKNLETLSDQIKNNYTWLSDELEKTQNQTKTSGLKTATYDELKRELKDAQSSPEVKAFIDTHQKISTFTKLTQTLTIIKNEITILESQNETTGLFNDLFNSAKKSTEIQDYDSAQETIIILQEQLNLQAKLSEEIKKTEKFLEQTISQEKITASDKTEFEAYLSKLQNIKQSYHEQNYEKTQDSIESLNQEIEKTLTNTIFNNVLDEQKFALSEYLINNRKTIIISLLAICIIMIFSWMIMKERIYNLRITRYTKKMDAIQNSIASAQRKYYKEKKISKETYQNLLDNHREALISTKEKLYVMQSRKNNKK